MGESPLDEYSGKDNPERLGELMDEAAGLSGATRAGETRADPISAGTATTAGPASASGERPRGAPAPAIAIGGYRVDREIARGGQAVVYEAVQASTGRRVAMKILSGGAFIGPSVRVRFEREVQILASLRHPNIVQIIDRGNTPDGSLYLVMDLISGKPLDKFLEFYYASHPDGPPPEDPSELLKLFLKIAEAVNAAHVRGVIHRDLKPSNIRVDERGEPHVLDFGLARPALASTGDGEGLPVTLIGTFLGSLPWASPEQAEGNAENLDVRTDVYSLGVILYQMLTGRFPYAVAGTMRDVLNNIITAAPTPPSRIAGPHPPGKRAKGKPASVGSIHPAIEAIVMKALAKSRDERYQSAGDLARDVRNYLAGRPTAVASAAAAPRLKTSAILAGSCAACLAVGIGTWYATRIARPAGTAPSALAPSAPASPTSPPPGIWAPGVAAPGVPAPPIATPTPAPPTAATVPIAHAAAPESQFPDPAGRRSFVNSIGMKLFHIDAGTFAMGAITPYTSKFPATQHRVTISKPFWMGATEVTVGQWKQFVDSTKYVASQDHEAINWRSPGWTVQDDQPVFCIGYSDAQAFCDWLSKTEGRTYRLPTEAEWEYTCRAGTHDDTWSGGPLTPDVAPLGAAAPAPGWALRPNPWGMRGMLGNLEETCSDWIDQYPAGPVVDPTGPDHQTGRNDIGEGKVQRGGWFKSTDPTHLCTAWARGWSAYGMGFRVVMNDPGAASGK